MHIIHHPHHDRQGWSGRATRNLAVAANIDDPLLRNRTPPHGHLPLFAKCGRSFVDGNLTKIVALTIPTSLRFPLIAISENVSCSYRAADSHAAWALARTMPHHPIHSILYTGVRPRRVYIRRALRDLPSSPTRTRRGNDGRRPSAPPRLHLLERLVGRLWNSQLVRATRHRLEAKESRNVPPPEPDEIRRTTRPPGLTLRLALVPPTHSFHRQAAPSHFHKPEHAFAAKAASAIFHYLQIVEDRSLTQSWSSLTPAQSQHLADSHL